jgi:glycosyltransferase involved in cell wall biosynthesis
VTIDSISEGVGSSQILPLLGRIADAGLAINLISFEKNLPSKSVVSELEKSKILWTKRAFEKPGYLGGLSRLLEMRSEITNTEIVHARSDIPAVAAILSREAPILWDIRSLWADQRAFMETNPLKKQAIGSLRILESIASVGSSAISTLTASVVPVLEARHKYLPKLKIVVPTAVDLDRFRFVSRLPTINSALYSGTYNDYYDLLLSKKFIEEMSKLGPLEVKWARPKESTRNALNAGEDSSFVANQIEMAGIIPNYSFGISICKIAAGPSLKAAMPTKAAEFLACGRPMVINAGLGDLDKYIEEFDAGVVLDGTDKNLVDKAQHLSELLADPGTPSRCRALAEKYFDIEEGVRKYLETYSLMLSNSH